MKTINRATRFILALSAVLMLALSFEGCGGPGSGTPVSTSPNCTEMNYTGRVIDSEDLSDIAGAEVKFDAPDTLADEHTDTFGGYRLTVCVKGDRLDGRLIVTADGYKPYVRNVTLWVNIPNIEDVRLVPIDGLEEGATSPTPTATLVSTVTVPPTLAPTVPTTRDVHPAVRQPALVQPEQGQSYKNPILFSWNGNLYSGQAYQVRAYNVRTGHVEQSGLLTSPNWRVDLPAKEYGEWRWKVAVVQGGRDVAVSNEGMFWFTSTSYSAPDTSVSPLSPP